MLYLVQHGEAVTKDIDPDRPLSDEGKLAVSDMATFLSNAGVYVDHIFHSGKTRARQTAEMFANSISESGIIEEIPGISPNDPVDALTTQLNHLDAPTMIVGHLPYLAKLVSQLLIQNSDQIIVHYLPGSVVCLDKDDKNHWTINWMVRPNLLK